jgi:hypothetical protein
MLRRLKSPDGDNPRKGLEHDSTFMAIVTLSVNLVVQVEVFIRL